MKTIYLCLSENMFLLDVHLQLVDSASGADFALSF